ncbi:hypothetical protein F4810DRAFT_261463 [Camillea tinctor]|nr:hypothetical protein F4810DRAFT_261463 [Camillea tinctor]
MGLRVVLLCMQLFLDNIPPISTVRTVHIHTHTYTYTKELGPASQTLSTYASPTPCYGSLGKTSLPPNHYGGWDGSMYTCGCSLFLFVSLFSRNPQQDRSYPSTMQNPHRKFCFIRHKSLAQGWRGARTCQRAGSRASFCSFNGLRHTKSKWPARIVAQGIG